ncbi:YuiB family protein [Massilibacterium senegalense]|uniref:YuiB family protein n=1 Tax=Massilibacterium senegalense TaxID=1632858 RepID=UPI000782930B|nr:YuiB family protein [Massilibacterium senegalense]
MSIPMLIISMLLFFVLFFGIGFLLNMILRVTWLMALIYPIVVFMIVYKMLDTKFSVSAILNGFTKLGGADIVILTTGFVGSVLAGVTIKTLRKKGYQMF